MARPLNQAVGSAQIPLYYTERVALPPQWIPERRAITILDVGKEGAMVAVTLAGLIDYLSSRRDGVSFQASPRMLYEMARRYDGTDGTGDTGTYLWAALYGWQQHGVTTEIAWPYIPGKRDSELTPERARLAEPFKPQSYERVPKDIQVVKAAIIDRGGVYAGQNVHKGWYQPEKGIIPYAPGAELLGASAFNLLGYTPDGFIIQNAWGEAWGGVDLDGQHYPGMAILTYPDFEANFLEGYGVRLWPESPEAGRKPALVRAGYQPDTPEDIDNDFLNIRPDVRAISNLLAAQDVKPPLALGLFGNWGTGKSFFMESMVHEIARLADQEKANPGKTPYCQPIVQIRFNAWHFMDTNLWASLVSELFDRLHAAISPPDAPLEEQRSRLIQALGDAQGLYRQSQLELKEAQQDLKVAETGLVILQVAQAVKADQVASTMQELAAQVGQLASLRTRVRRLVFVLFQDRRWPGRLAWLVVLALGAAVAGWLLSWLASAFPQAFGQASHWISASWTWAVGALAWLAGLWRTAGTYLDQLEEKSRLACQLTDQQLRYPASLVEKNEAANRLDQAVQQAEKKAEEARLQVDRVQKELDALSPRWQMEAYINERCASQDYRSQLGMISLIRKDFDKLNSLLQESTSGSPGGQGGTAADQPRLPFKRIILYIDDLDRCQPKRVVEVLEAVHLLLSYPLFVVVVAVDPRWLRTCLEMVYPELLSIQEDGQGEALDQPATPQDYLEKIFQIPFYLKPINAYGYSAMIRGLVGPDVDPESRSKATPGGGQPGGQSIPGAIPPGETIQAGGEPGPGGAGMAGGGEEEPKKAAEPPINPDLLKFKAWEEDDLQRLSPLFRTPRAVKRFINTYRLVKVGIDPNKMDEFEGARSAPGTARIAQALLAVVAGYPNLAEHFLQLLLAQVHAEKPVKTWSGFLAACKSAPAIHPDGGRPVQRSKSASAAQTPGAEEQAWQQMIAALGAVSADGFLPDDLEPYIEMVSRVARFSFSVSDLPVLRKP